MTAGRWSSLLMLVAVTVIARSAPAQQTPCPTDCAEEEKDGRGCCIPAKAAAPRGECAPGKERSALTNSECCWPGQRWDPTKTACVGLPTSCPEKLMPEGDACVPTRLVVSPSGLKMWRLDAGHYMMGSFPSELGRYPDETLTSVWITKGFYISTTEVTQATFKAIMGDNPAFFVGSDLPVEHVSWYDALAFCNAVSEAEGLKKAYTEDGDNIRWDPRANGYRLPTEAEWEYAARAGTENMVFSGADTIGEVAWYADNSDRSTHDVATLKPNAWNLYDMSGNVWEWIWDAYTATAPGGEDPVVNYGVLRVIRGGAWSSRERAVRIARRGNSEPVISLDSLGFRVVRNAE